MSEKEINKILSINKLLLLIPIIIFTIGVLLFNYGISETNKEKLSNKNSTVLYGDLIQKNEDAKSIQYAKVDIKYIERFAYENHLNYYFALDNDNYIYVLRVTDKTFDKMKVVYQKNKDNFNYEVFGWTHKIDTDVKKLAISSINKLYEGSLNLNDSNYEKYLGNTYLDETISQNFNINALCVGCGVFLIIFSLIVLIFHFIQKINIKKIFNKYNIDNLNYELRSCNTIVYKKEKIYLTSKYIISTFSGLKVFEYNDIYWLYNEQRKYNGVNIGTYLNARLINKKLVSIAYSLKKPEVLIEIMNNVILKNNKVLMGFTPENKKKYQEYKKTTSI